MTKFIAAIDQGTTSTRCILFDHQGNSVGMDQKEHRQIYPRPGWVEHNAMEILQNSQEVFTNALRRSSLGLEDVAAIGITNQRETAVIWDRHTGIPYHNAKIGRAHV